MKKRIIALALSVYMLLSLILTQALADTIPILPFYPNADAGNGYNSTASGETIFNDMLNQAAPGSFSDDTLTPYGTQKGEAFTLLEKAEIFEYAADGGTSYAPTFYDNLTTGSSLGYSTASLVNADKLPALYFAKGVAFDATGSGRRDHVAIVGYRKEATGVIGASAWLYVINAETKEVVDNKILQSSEALSALLANLTVVDSNNLLQITAGDYNGDGKDSLVIYSVTDMFEYTYGKGNCELIHGHVAGRGNSDSYDIISKYLHTEYNYTSIDNIDSAVKNRLCTSLASGDVNGDGIDDLVVISYTAAADGKYVKSTSPDYNFPGTCLPQLSVGYGERDAEKTVADLSIDTESVCQENAQYPERIDTMAYPDIAIGDIDGDGKNEIIAAGYNNVPLRASYEGMYLADNDDDVGNLAFGKYAVTYAYYETSGAGKLHRSGKIRTLAKDGAVSPITKGDSLRETEDLCQQFSVECVALDGLHSQEYVFLSGWFYYMDSNGDLKKISGNESPGNPFKTLTTKIDGTDVDEVYIHSASVGNVFGSDKDEEAITLVIGYKKHTNPNEEGSYYFKQYVFWNGSSSGTEKTVKFATLGDETRPMKMLNKLDGSTKFVTGKNNSLSMLLLTVDYGNDSVVAKYSGKAYAYTDPTVVAFLQAAPYFSEMEAGNNSTQYSYSESYRVSNGTSTEVSYDVGFAMEVEVGPITAGMDTGFAYELNQEFVNSIDKTYTTTFEANDQNLVILRQTLLYYYAYDIADYNPDTKEYEFVENAMVVSAPQYPVLTSLSMDQYNELAAAYNKKVEESTDSNVDKTHKMDLITDELKEKYFLNNEGNPFAYASDASDYTYNGIPGWDLSEASVGGTDTWMKLSYAGGTQTQTYSVTLEEEKTKSVAEGCFVNTTLMAGGGAFGFSAYAGATAGYERLEGESISTASMTSTETSGTVQNLTSDLYYYGFDWKLIGWKTDDLFAGVPFLGYAVKNQKDLPKAVNDLKAVYSAEDKTVTLTWTSPTEDPGRMPTQYYYAYNDLQDSYIKACSKKEHSMTIDVSGYSASGATFTIVPFNEDHNLRGMPSNEAYCLFVMSNQEISALIKDLQDKIDALTTELEEQNSDFEATIADLIKAYQAADELLKSRVDDLEAAQKALSDVMAEADDLLQKAIDKVNADLSAAIENLRKATDEALEQAITDLTDAYNCADALLKADIDALSGKLAALEKTMNKADDALLEAIEQVQADLDATKKDLESTMAEDIDALRTELETKHKEDIDALRTELEAKHNEDIDALRAELEAKHKEDIDALRTELEAKHKEDVDALRTELETLKTQISDQDKINSTAIQTLKSVNNTQQEETDTSRLITIVALCIGSVSLLGNAALLVFLLKKKFLTK
ncbi:MAG: hypothetical protein ACI4II_02260 [Acutalibacteraceae bacterium]